MVISGVGLQEERHAMSGQPGPKSWPLPVAMLPSKCASACNDALWGRTAGKERHQSGVHPGPKSLTLPVFPWLALKENDDSAMETEKPVKKEMGTIYDTCPRTVPAGGMGRALADNRLVKPEPIIKILPPTSWFPRASHR